MLNLSPQDIKPRDLFIIRNLILPRSLNDNMIDGKTPFRVNSRVDPLIFESQTHLREKTKRIIENRKINFES